MNATNHNPAFWGTIMERHERPRTALKRVETLREREEIETLREREEMDRLSRRYNELTAIAAQMIEECWRLQTDNEDLRASAKIWIRMYEQQVQRANALEQQLLEGPRRV